MFLFTRYQQLFKQDQFLTPIMWRILKTELFEKKFNKLDKSLQEQIENIKKQLEYNPYVGDALQVEFFREKRIGKFRIYYLIYKEYVIVYMITISGKKDQQKAIDTVLLFLDKYKEEIEQWVEKYKS